MINKKQGHIDLATGLVFIEKRKHCKNGEYWVTPEKFETYKKRKNAASKKFRALNEVKTRQASRDSYSKHREKRLAYNRANWAANKIEMALKHKQWKKANKEYIRSYYQNYYKERRLRDPLFALSNRCRTRITDIFRRMGFTKKAKSLEMLGCDWDTLKQFIESKFVEGMSWSNRDQWHIDHIIPLASASTEERLIELCHYSNLQPLWASDNMSKGAKIILDYSLEKHDTTAIV